MIIKVIIDSTTTQEYSTDSITIDKRQNLVFTTNCIDKASRVIPIVDVISIEDSEQQPSLVALTDYLQMRDDPENPDSFDAIEAELLSNTGE